MMLEAEHCHHLPDFADIGFGDKRTNLSLNTNVYVKFI